MTEAGGSTTQSGITYQNSVAALFLGRLLDVSNRPEKERVESVRVEAPTEVDDVVITFGDTHKMYIQAKEHIKNNTAEWKTLWKHLDEQFRSTEFHKGSDRLAIHIGFGLQEHYELQDTCNRAANSQSLGEWQGRLAENHKEILNKVSPYLSPVGLTDEYLWELLAHVEIEIMPLQSIERDRLRDWMPHTNRTHLELFRVLRDRVGGEARVKGTFTAPSLRKDLIAESPDLKFEEPVDLASMRLEIKQCGALLRQVQNTISGTNIHIKVDVAERISDWLLDDSYTEKNVSMLLDQAGMGKTVVMREILENIENRKIDVFAIKADQQLSNINTLNDIQGKLNLSQSAERIISRLAQLNRVVVLIDQIDALSLSLAHDQQSLDILLDFIARIRRISNVRILLSCRIFDRNTDPRLKTIEIEHTFALSKLSDDQVRNVLAQLQVNYDELTLATQNILGIPLHLDLFARALSTNDIEFKYLRDISSLQELYSLIWQHVVTRQDVNNPSVSDRIEVINRLTEFMNTHQRTSAPQSVFFTRETKHLERAVNFLASIGILIQGKTEWSFLHQTFFDYSYARQFVEGGNNIVTTILDSQQGIFERPKLIQVIAYLRNVDHTRYIFDLNQLLKAPNLHFHLYDLLLRWFGALPNPTDDEWFFAQGMMAEDDEHFSRLISVMYGNLGWFQRLKLLIPSLLTGSDTRGFVTIDYLGSLIDIAQDDVIAILEKFYNRNDEWKERIAFIFAHIRNWQTQSAVNFYERSVYETKTMQRRSLLGLEEVCQKSPVTGCRIIKFLFDQALDSNLTSLSTDKEKTLTQSISAFFLDNALKDLQGYIEKALAVVSTNAPQEYAELMLPFIERVVNFQKPYNDRPYFTADALSYNWYEDTFLIQRAFIQGFIDALLHIATNQPEMFKTIERRLSCLDYETPQQLLTYIYRKLPETYAESAFNFLIGDWRRFHIGEHEQYDSRQVIHAIFPYLSRNQQLQLESRILEYRLPPVKSLGLNALRWSGIEQYILLDSVPYQLLTLQGRKQLIEWQNKFPDKPFSDKPLIMQGGVVPSPISPEAALKMSDRSWLRAMDKYQHNVRRGSLGGGSRQLSGVLAGQIKDDPQRFHLLYGKISQDIDDVYVLAFANGFADSNSPEEWIFDVFRRYSTRDSIEIRRGLSYTIQRLANKNVPSDIIAKLSEWVHSPEGETESWWEKGKNNGSIYECYINSERGAAFAALMRIFDAESPEQVHKQKWDLIEFASSDGSTAIRLGAIEELSYMLHYDRDRAWFLFEKLMIGKDILLDATQVREFLHWGMYKNFLRAKPYIEKMIERLKPETQEMGAELACIAAISDVAMESDAALNVAQELAGKTLGGSPSLRRGAATVYVFNATHGSEPAIRSRCAEKLKNLINDDDEEICKKIDNIFFHLHEGLFFELKSLVGELALSKQHPMSYALADYLWNHGMLDPAWTLDIIKKMIGKSTQPQEWAAGAEEMMRFVLRVYTSQVSENTLREEAINIFDLLMKKYAGTANKILSEWDRR